ncbi:hypothetical protein [Pelosinus sp. IPA-1]|uniref:hypothetical protein n=1 Tax=Pelosinus sp. IPA-1 TaxID=3029569 RepID=UPI002436188F|nr:hypothetical protein [Pelosinus sp. IPA-1]GMB01077.1 hypothetical protein PIPA1_38760 [Pelosinus sp. IPA-1]
MVSNFFSSLVSSLLSPSNSSSTANQPPKIYLQCNKEKIQFPIPPSSFEVSVKQNNSTVNINNLGELNMIGKTGLITMSFSSFLPNQNYDFCQCTADKPYNYVKTIEKWRTSGQPSRFTITETPVNYPVSIESFKYGEKDGTGDVYFTIDFKEYKYTGNAVDNTVSDVTGLSNRSDASTIADTTKNITVYPGDSLLDVASRAMGSTIKKGSNSYLDLYKSLAKRGGISTGDIISVTKNNTVKIGDSNVSL